MPRSTLASTILATTLALGASLAAAPPAHAASTVEGVLRTVAVDTTDRGSARAPRRSAPATDAQVLVVGNRTYRVRGKHGRPNTRVRITGALAGGSVEATSLTTLAAAPNALPAAGTTHVLVILAYWTAPDAVTPTSAASVLFGATNDWYRRASYGALGQAGTVTPWLRIAGPAAGRCYGDSSTTMSQAQTAAAAAGFALDQYTSYVLYSPWCGGDALNAAGWAVVGGGYTWFNGYLTPRETVHELGHNYGLWHSHSDLCSAGGLGGTCAFQDYGDPFDAMGDSNYVAQFNASQKTLLGWMRGRTADLTAGGTATLAPLGTAATSVQSAVVTVSPGRSYWLEYRQPTGDDAALPPNATNGLLVHVRDDSISLAASPAVGGTGANLIDVQGDPTISTGTATLLPGGSWISPEGARIHLDTLSASSASVTVGVPAVPAPAALAVSQPAAGTATLSWSPPPGLTSSLITGYLVGRDGVDAHGGGAWSTSTASAARSQSFTYLVPGSTYQLSVRALTAAGAGPAATATVTIPAAGLPGAPATLTASTAGTQATVTWTAPTLSGSSPITGYRVSRDGVDAHGGGPWSTTTAGTTRSLTFAYLTPGSTYHLSVRAINGAGAGPGRSGTVLIAGPSAPRNLSVLTDRAAHTATLGWAAPATTQGLVVTGYRVSRDGSDSTGGGAYTTTIAGSALSFAFSLLVPASTYTFTVQAITAQAPGAVAAVSATL